MSSEFGQKLRISLFGESHGPCVGAVIDGFPAGMKVDFEALRAMMDRRAPGRDPTATARKEADEVEILSGLKEGVTTGAPIAGIIRNTDCRSADYEELSRVLRPGHADFAARKKFGEAAELRGGGHFSARLTAPLTFAGALCRQALAERGIVLGAHLLRAGRAEDLPFSDFPGPEEFRLLPAFPVRSQKAEAAMRAEIEAAKAEGDSLGGVVECAAVGLPAGLGGPWFGSAESLLSAALFGIPAVKGVEFGRGFAAAGMRGSAHNDPFVLREGEAALGGNRHGGVLGGITSGCPLIFRAAFKPTPSIAAEQQSVDLSGPKEVCFRVRGRHDPCVAVRAVPVVEAVAAAVLLDLCLLGI